MDHGTAAEKSNATSTENRPLLKGALAGASIAAKMALLGATALISAAASKPGAAQAPARPNIVVIMGDDIGIWNIGAYHRGMMAGRTPNLDKIAAEGMLFTDYYAEASCTAGRANFSPASCRSAPA